MEPSLRCVANGMIDQHEGLIRAHGEFSARVSLVTSDHWDTQSACDEWTIGDLVDHVIGGNAFTVAILKGVSAEDAMQTAIKTVELNADRRPEAIEHTAAAMIELVSAAATPGRVYHHVEGDMERGRVVTLRINDITLHAWDLARSLGADEMLDEDLVELVWTAMSPLAEDLATSGRFGTGASGLIAEDAPLQARLIDLTGRGYS